MLHNYENLTQMLVSDKSEEKSHKIISVESNGIFQLKCGKEDFNSIMFPIFFLNQGETDIQRNARFTEF